MSRIHNSVQHRKHSAKCLQGKTELSRSTFLTWLDIRQICRFIGYRSLLLLRSIAFKSLASGEVYQISPVCLSPNLTFYAKCPILSSHYHAQYLQITVTFHSRSSSSKKCSYEVTKRPSRGIRYHPWLLLEAQRLWGTRFWCNISQGLYIGVHNGA